MAFVVTALVATTASTAAFADAEAWQAERYPYSVVSENVHDALTNFGYNLGVRVMVSPHVAGVVQGRRADGSARQFLDDVTRANDLDWYSDGTVIYVSPSSEEQTAVVPLNGFSFDVMKKELEQQKLFDDRFRMTKQIGDGAAILSGPPSFVAVMKQAIEARVGNGIESIPGASQDLVVLRGSQSSSMKVR
ncbi:hypothetical protein [Rhizosaccharibacter radicis]|uniref:Type III secretion protein n=1 Tax=Rhizosaccharibacter radicis TaxID=2782605 RepID=A0ABT1VTF6_9PROT|nr:hypothetical protein [Acetobacteraceae bacterium KSS12]